MNVLVFGAGGMLARDVVTAAPSDVTPIAVTRADCDVSDAGAVRRVLDQAAPDVIVNCAAYTAVDRAETEVEAAEAVNAVAPGVIGRAAGSVPVVHFSTDYVFAGTGDRGYRETDPTGPLGVYGRTKLAGEEALRTSGAPYVMLRTSWLYGVHGRSFPRTMWERARAGRATRVVNDQWGRPTYTRDLAEAVWTLVACVHGPARLGVHVFHASNTGTPITWYGIAERVFVRAGRPDLLSPCATADYPTPARRPAWSVLDTSLFDQFATPLPDWEDALDRFLDLLEAE